MTTQSLPYSFIKSMQPTTVQGYKVDGIDPDGRPIRIRKNLQGGYILKIGTTLPTPYGMGKVKGYTPDGNMRVAITQWNDEYEYELADGSDILTAQEKVAMLSACANASVESLIETITRLYKSESTDKLTKTWQAKVDAIERFNPNEYVRVVSPMSYIAGYTDIVVDVVTLDRESKAERKRRIAKERKQAKALADRLLAQYGDDSIPDEIMGELDDAY
jgi:hypothetical protein